MEKLPESERTVVTLYYLGEMTTKDIGNFLGVSVNTVKSRLRRGRERLQAAESLVRDVLGGVQLPADLTARIMRQVADINPTVPPTGKPLVPWVAFGAATILFVLLLGVSHQYLARFQNRIVSMRDLNRRLKSLTRLWCLMLYRNRLYETSWVGLLHLGKAWGLVRSFLRQRYAVYPEEDLRRFSTEQWAQTDGPPGGHVRDIHTVSDGTTFAFSATGMYKLEPEGATWRPLNSGIPIDESLMPMAENRGMLYVVSTNEIFASADKGETWDVFCVRPKGDAIGLIITEETQAPNSQSDMTMYLALRDDGVFQSVDNGVQWHLLSDGLKDGKDFGNHCCRKNTVYWHKPRSLPSGFRCLAKVAGR